MLQKGLPEISPLTVVEKYKIECSLSFFVVFNYVLLEGREVCMFRGDARCSIIKSPEPGMGIPVMVRDSVRDML